jgi:hypothetical protein
MCSAEKYNSEDNTWSPIPDMHTARTRFAIAVIGDKIFVIGGNDGFADVCSVEYFDKKKVINGEFICEFRISLQIIH